MRYPVVEQRDAVAYIDGRRDGSILAKTDPEIAWRGQGEDAEGVIEGACEDLHDEWKAAVPEDIPRGLPRDELEGRLAIEFFETLSELPPEVLTDRGFWRYLSVARLFEFIQWRDGENCQHVSFGAGQGARWDCVPLRMFNRAMIAETGGLAIEADDVFWGSRVAGTDLWRSHILRVLIGNAPIVVHEILVNAQAGKLPTTTLRHFVKGLQRTRANVLFELMDSDQARQLVDAQLRHTRVDLQPKGRGRLESKHDDSAGRPGPGRGS